MKIYTVQDFIYQGARFIPKNTPLSNDGGDIHYARFVMMMHDVPATLSFDIEPYVKQHPLYCMYEGCKHKFIGVSRLGDVFITAYLGRDSYDKRVPIEKLYQFSASV